MTLICVVLYLSLTIKIKAPIIRLLFGPEMAPKESCRFGEAEKNPKQR